MKTPETKAKPIRIFTDGSGCRPDGKGSSIAWFREDTGQKQILREDGLTNNQAEYRGILAALESLPVGAEVEILTDSENTCFQLRGQRRVLNPTLIKLYDAINALVQKQRLKIVFTWIPRRENLAGKLI